ncbi:hypothetical protein [Photobacterium leiognathi]|nr:hypothetical protein [Photobacterium leiognathi]KJF89429.1 hypothetical protein UB42_13235 [Photobacterium leiognathi]
MKNIYQHRLFIITSVILFILINSSIYFLSKNKKFNFIEEKNNLNNLISKLIVSHEFQDNIYTDNIEDLKESLDSIVKYYNEIYPNLFICLSLNVNSFSKKQDNSIISCAEYNSIRYIGNNFIVKNASGSSNITFNDKNFGILMWYISANEKNILSKFYLNSSFADFLFFLEILLLLTSTLFLINKKTNEVIIKDLENQNKIMIQKINNVKNIVLKNKRSFPTNDKLIIASYYHPYTIIHFIDGKNDRLRCSLAELENSFELEFIRVNRSCMVVKQHLFSFGDISLSTDKSNHQLLLDIKGTIHTISIGKKYESQLISLLSMRKYNRNF